MQLDLAFSPTQTLTGQGGEAWLDSLRRRITPQLSASGRSKLGDDEVNEWCQAHSIVQTAVDRVYNLLLSTPELVEWVAGDYFTSWSLCDRLARELCGAPQTAILDTHADYAGLHTLGRIPDRSVRSAFQRLDDEPERWRGRVKKWRLQVDEVYSVIVEVKLSPLITFRCAWVGVSDSILNLLQFRAVL